MKFIFYTHSLVSDWNHGNAHFQRGVMRDLAARGHQVLALEPEGGWSRMNLARDQGPRAIKRFWADFPNLPVATYRSGQDHEDLIGDADVVIVHEWTDPSLVAHIGRLRQAGGRFTLLFHDTHHRAVSSEQAITDLQLNAYDAILCFGGSLREIYIRSGRHPYAFTWHEAADVRLFRPLDVPRDHDVVWVGNWGDGERAREIEEFLIQPTRAADLSGSVHGVRYPAHALRSLAATRLIYRGWLANADVPDTFARHRFTLHIPRRPYIEALPGIPTIRVFEALACGIPLISASWRDCERLFRPDDFLMVRDGAEMTEAMLTLLHNPDDAEAMAARARETILSRHTCAHRVDELFAILSHCATDRVRQQLVSMEAAE